jgi:hypothetical protein
MPLIDKALEKGVDTDLSKRKQTVKSAGHGSRYGNLPVEASDNTRVARVRVTILDEQGKMIERGYGVREIGGNIRLRRKARRFSLKPGICQRM